VRRAGIEVLAHWREAGEWWENQPGREVLRYLDERGIRREEISQLPALGERFFKEVGKEPWIESHREEVSLRVRKLRDEKVSIACGYGGDPDFSKVAQLSGKSYCLLHAISAYSFGRSSMGAADIPLQAAHRGVGSALLADYYSLGGAVEFCKSARKVGLKPLIGATFQLPEGDEFVLVAQTYNGYRNISHLITECQLDEPRLFPLCTWERLGRHTKDVLCLSGGSLGGLATDLSRGQLRQAEDHLAKLVELYGRTNVFVQIERSFLPWEQKVNKLQLELADRMGVTAVAAAVTSHANRDDFPAQDILSCIESLCLVDEVIGRKPLRHPEQPQGNLNPMRGLNAERFLRSPAEMAFLFSDRLDLLENTQRVADLCDADVLPKRTQLPPIFDDDALAIRDAAYAGARQRLRTDDYGTKRRLDLELERIIRNGFARHFLVAYDMCRWAASQGILYSGRGSVVDSLVAYCLGMSRINAYHHNLHFDRFLPEDAAKRPDIDIDFEARRRDDVRNYLVRKYGDRNVATVAAVGTYCTRGIVREVGKAMGIPNDLLGYLTKRLHGSVSPERLEQAIDAKPELRESGIPRAAFHWVFKLAELMMDLPRNMRAHSSGVVISRDPIADTVPMMYSGAEDVKILQWDKRSAKPYFDKFDVLCLRGQDVLSGTQTRIRRQQPDFDVEQVSLEDAETYRTMRSGHLIGIPQSASPAMRQAHIRLRTENLTDASLVQAGIRPGVGGAVKINELIARRRGKPYELLDPKLDEILGKTYGIVVFQEQVDQLLQTFGGYSSDEAEEVREAIHKLRHESYAASIHDVVLARIQEQGFSEAVAEEVYQLVGGFQGYGFAEGHALAFAEISVRSIWCQQNFPAPYFAALLDAQPAGYYGPCTLANEARNRNVKMLSPNVNASGIRFIVEDVVSEEDPKIAFPDGGIRTSLEQINGLSKETITRIVDGREKQNYATLADFVARVRPDRDELERLILCGALDSLHPNRRMLLWGIPKAMEFASLVEGHAPSCLSADGAAPSSNGVLPLIHHEPVLQEVEDFDEVEKAIHERRLLGMDIKQHLTAFERERISAKGGFSSHEASNLEPGKTGFVVGNPIRLRFPPTASGKRVMFFDLEDETGLLNVTCFDDMYQQYGHIVVCSPYITLWGEAQDRDGHIAFLAHKIFPYQPTLSAKRLTKEPLPVLTADFLAR